MSLWSCHRLKNVRVVVSTENKKREQLMSKENKAKFVCALAAFFSFLFSIYLWFSGMKNEGLFVGLWVPSILASGILLLMPVRGKNG
jgi:hypothetical protein